MDFFKSVFSYDPFPFDNLHLDAQNDGVDLNPNWEPNRSPRPNYSIGEWSFRGLICDEVRVFQVWVEEGGDSDPGGGFTRRQRSSWFAPGRRISGSG
ncbi:protein DOS2-like [Pyrus ussuriensis x Pyrus communis]|uniref:Protein DOS2-like n=1 Tax=Pyrus ussuriensis x Pyrus communis TaxID=2448454 RepID=A0A5N5F7D2_9ROSA|nr:protein DOS2-like [Pyrus ussuriensis x Pyrus communis]